MTVRFNTTLVRNDESAGILTFILVTNRPVDVPFTVQVSTEDLSLIDDPTPFPGRVATGKIDYYNNYDDTVKEYHICISVYCAVEIY